MAFVVWLLSPYTKGASLLYRKLVHPTLSSKEKVMLFLTQATVVGEWTAVPIVLFSPFFSTKIMQSIS